jgi:hypothetical protein
MGLVLRVEIIGHNVIGVGRVFVVDVIRGFVLPGGILPDLTFIDGGKG